MSGLGRFSQSGHKCMLRVASIVLIHTLDQNVLTQLVFDYRMLPEQGLLALCQFCSGLGSEIFKTKSTTTILLYKTSKSRLYIDQ